MQLLGDLGQPIEAAFASFDRVPGAADGLRSVNRLAVGLITAALIVGSYILLWVVKSDVSTAVWLLGVLGIVIAFANGVWLIASMRRSRDRGTL